MGLTRVVSVSCNPEQQGPLRNNLKRYYQLFFVIFAKKVRVKTPYIMKKILYLSIVLFFSSTVLFAQTRQMQFSDSTGGTLVFNDTKVDDSGFIVTAGTLKISGDDMGILMKTDKKGNLVWKKKFPFTQFNHLKIAANGDYLVASNDKFYMRVARVAPNGDTVWTSHTGFWAHKSFSTNGLTEMANGDVAICGTNSFGYWNPNANYFDGWVQVFSGIDGTPKWSNAYVSPTQGGQFYFTGLTAHNDTLIIGGAYDPFGGAPLRNFIMRAGPLGQVISIKYFDSSMASNSKILANADWTFRNMSVISDKIYVSGVFAERPANKEVLHVSVYDESTGSLSGHVYNLAGSSMNSARTYIKDTNEYYLFTNTDTAWTITAKILNDTPQFVKALRSDNKTVKAVTGQGDTIVLVGNVKGQALYAYTGNSSVTENACTVLDTSMIITTYSQALTNGTVPDVFAEFLSSAYNMNAPVNAALARTYLCAPPDTGTGVSILPGGTATKVYPNPTNGIVHISSPAEKLHYNLYNALGILCGTGTLSSRQPTINLGDMPSGLYILELADNQNTIQKFRITRW